MFTASLFTIAKLWEQQRCPTKDKWIKKMWHLYTMEFHSAMNKNEMLSFNFWSPKVGAIGIILVKITW
jgi:hypothetical protein